MVSSKVAMRYAKSIFGLAAEKGLNEVVSADMQLIGKTCNDNRDLTALLNSPVIGTVKKLSVLNAIFKGKVNDLTLSFVDMVATKGRESYLPVIANQYAELYKLSKGIQTATVTTAVALDASLKDQIKAIVAKITPGKQIELEEKINTNLIGGFVLRVNDKQYDNSVAASLRRLTKDFSGNVYINQN